MTQQKGFCHSCRSPRQGVYGLLCQQVTSSRCWFVCSWLCCTSEAETCKQSWKMNRWRWTWHSVVISCPPLTHAFANAPGLKGQKGELIHNLIHCHTFFSHYFKCCFTPESTPPSYSPDYTNLKILMTSLTACDEREIYNVDELSFNSIVA